MSWHGQEESSPHASAFVPKQWPQRLACTARVETKCRLASPLPSNCWMAWPRSKGQRVSLGSPPPAPSKSSHRGPVAETAGRLWRSDRKALLRSMRSGGLSQKSRPTGRFDRWPAETTTILDSPVFPVSTRWNAQVRFCVAAWWMRSPTVELGSDQKCWNHNNYKSESQRYFFFFLKVLLHNIPTELWYWYKGFFCLFSYWNKRKWDGFYFQSTNCTT